MIATNTPDHASTLAIGPEFLGAGRACFTIENPAGEHYTFRIVECYKHGSVDSPPPLLASILTGPDNEYDYTYVGRYLPDAGKIRLTSKSRFTDDSKPVRVLRWAVAILHGRQSLPAGYQIRHEGRCGRCGRTLTEPRSLDCGIGPECRKLMGLG